MRIKEILGVLILGLGAMLTLVGCGGGGGGVVTSTVSGTASIGDVAVSGAEVALYAIDESGQVQVIGAQGAPVVTDAAGLFEYDIALSDLASVSGPLYLILRDGMVADNPSDELATLILDPLVLQSATEPTQVLVNGLTTTAFASVQRVVDGSRWSAESVASQLQEINQVLGLEWNDAADCSEFDELVVKNLADESLVGAFAQFLADDLSDGTVNGQDHNGNALNTASYGALASALPSLEFFQMAEVVTQDLSFGSNGIDSTQLIVGIQDATGAPVVDALVIFSVSAGNAQLSGQEVITDSNGEATVELTSTTAGTVTVAYSYTLPSGFILSGTQTFEVSDCQAVAGVTLTTDATSILDSGNEYALITADVAAACAGSEVPDGTLVNFAIAGGSGELDALVAETLDGQAQVTVTGLDISTLVVEALVAGYSDNVSVRVVGDPCAPGNISVTSDATAITTAGEALITATVEPVDASACTFGVADGTLIDFVLSGPGSLSGGSIATVDGEVTVAFIPVSAGEVTVTGAVGSLSDGAAIAVQTQPTTTVLTVNLQGVAAGTIIGGISLTLDYDQSQVAFDAVDAGTLTPGATVIPNDSGDTVMVGLISATGFDASAAGTALSFDFSVDGGVPASTDFSVTSFQATNLNGETLEIDAGNLVLQVTNQ